jgi:hypothetical protein
MKKTTLIASALAALGIISQAGAATTNFVYITGSTAFRANVFNTLSVGVPGHPGAIFDAAPTILPAGANSGSGKIVYQGKIGGTNYTIDCNWTGSEAGIAATSGATSLFNASVGGTNYNLPGVPVTFLDPNTGNAGTNTTTPDLAFADTSQAVSLTPNSGSTKLVDYGCVGIVPFTWLKGKNTAPDSSWTDCTNISQAQIFYLLGAADNTMTASFITGNANDADGVYLVGRNRGSGTHVNTFLKSLYYGVATTAHQYALNAQYISGVLTYYTNTGNYFPAVSLSGSYPGIVVTENDGWDSGAFVSDTLSCDIKGTNALILGYAGLGDAKHARDGQGDKSGAGLANQPAGAVFVSLDGFGMTDGNVANGNYSFWGHEHLLGQNGQSPSSAGGIIAGLLPAAVSAVGGLGDAGVTPNGQDSGILSASMNVDTPGNGGTAGNGADAGYPSPL